MLPAWSVSVDLQYIYAPTRREKCRTSRVITGISVWGFETWPRQRININAYILICVWLQASRTWICSGIRKWLPRQSIRRYNRDTVTTAIPCYFPMLVNLDVKKNFQMRWRGLGLPSERCKMYDALDLLKLIDTFINACISKEINTYLLTWNRVKPLTTATFEILTLRRLANNVNQVRALVGWQRYRIHT